MLLGMLRATFASWPTRRWLLLAALAPALLAVFTALAGTGPAGASPAWLALVLVAALVGAAVLASYVPARGLALELGCTPCAIMSGMTVLGASMAMRNYGTGIEGPAVAVAVTLFGLTQRLSQPATCPTPSTSRRP